MSAITPGWYKDPADPTTQRYWDGEGWIGDPISAEATPPAGPPAVARPEPIVPSAPTAPSPPRRSAEPAGAQPPAQSRAPLPPPGWPREYPYPYPRDAPPPRPHGLQLAEGGSRFAARVVDVIAVLGLCVVANAWLAVKWWAAFEPYLRQLATYQANGGSMPAPPGAVSYLLFMMLVVTTAVWFAYEVPSSANSGQTLGKRLLGIKVVRLDSAERLGFGRSFRRWARLGLPTLLWSPWICFGVGFVLQFVDCLFVLIDRPLRQALHDKAAATVVVQVGRSRPTDPAQLTPSGGRHADPR